MLKYLIVSKVRVKILELLLTNPNEVFHVREITRRTNEEINAVRRELSHLEESGFLTSERRANRLVYFFRSDNILYQDLLSMVYKTSGLGGKIVKNKSKLGKIKFATLSLSFAKGKPYNPDKIDLLVIGDVALTDLAKIVRDEEIRIEREINFTPMTEEEFIFRKNRTDPFIEEVLRSPRIMLIGDEEDLLRAKAAVVS